MAEEKKKNESVLSITKTYRAGDEEITLSPKMAMNFLVEGRNVTESEAISFVNLCVYNHLNPFVGDAFLIKYGEKAQMVVSKQAFMKRADHNPEYDGFRAGLIVQTKDGKIEDREGSFKLPDDTLLGGWCEVYRKGFRVPIVSRIALSEYKKTASSGKPTTWTTMEATMIRKVAVAHAHREAFTNDYKGMYLAEEFGYAEERLKSVKGERVQDNGREKKFDRELAGGQLIKTAGITGEAIHAIQNIMDVSEKARKDYLYYLKNRGDLQDMTFLTEVEGEELKGLMMKYADLDDDVTVDTDADNADTDNDIDNHSADVPNASDILFE